MRRILFLLVSLLLVSNMCFAKFEYKVENYQYKLFSGGNPVAYMVAPSHWRQYFPNPVGADRGLIFVKAPDDKAFASIIRNDVVLPYNDFSELTPYEVMSMSVDDKINLQKRFTPDAHVEVKEGVWRNHKAIFHLVLGGQFRSGSFPNGSYIYHGIKFVHNRHVHTIQIMYEYELMNSVDVDRMFDSVVLYGLPPASSGGLG